MVNMLKNNLFNFIKIPFEFIRMIISGVMTAILFLLFLGVTLSILFVITSPVLAQSGWGLKEVKEVRETGNSSMVSEVEKVGEVKEVSLEKRAIGWHWYNETYPEDKEPKENIEINNNVEKDEEKNEIEADSKDIKDDKNLNKKRKTATYQMEQLRKSVQEAKARAILYPTVENMRAYLILQNYVTNQALLFTKAWKETLLAYPELDYSILHPTQNSAQHIIYAEISKREKEAMRAFGMKYGLFFFYRGKEALDRALAPIIEAFGRENNIALIPISVDGKKIDVFGNNYINNGQAEKLGIKHLPALILVDPKNKKVIPLNYGFISEAELRRRFLQVATGFKEGV